MDKSLIIVLVVAVLIVGVVMYSSSQQSKRDRELALQLQQMNKGTDPQANLWSSLGDIGSLVGMFGGMFGGGGGTISTFNEGARFGSPFENNDDNPFMTQGQASELGQEFLKMKIEGKDYDEFSFDNINVT